MIQLGLWPLGFKGDLYVYQKNPQSQKIKKKKLKKSNKPCDFQAQTKVGRPGLQDQPPHGEDPLLALVAFPFKKHLNSWKNPRT